jgi:hypothetical protein
VSNGPFVQNSLQYENIAIYIYIYIAIVISSYDFYFHNFEDGTYPKWPLCIEKALIIFSLQYENIAIYIYCIFISS